MKKFLALLLALAMIASLAACGSKTDAPATTAATEAPATEAPETTTAAPTVPNRAILGSTTELGGDFRWPGFGGSSAGASDQDINRLTAGYSTMETNQGGAYVWNETVVKSHSETENEDGTYTVTIELNEGLTFSDGSPVTAANYVAGILAFSTQVSVGAGHSGKSGQSFVGYSDFYAYTGEEGTGSKVFTGVRMLDDYNFSLTVSSDFYPYYFAYTYAAVSPDPLGLVLGEGVEVKDDGEGCYLSDNFYEKNGDEYVKAAEIAANRYDVTKYPFSGPYVISNWDASTKEATLTINPEFKGNFEGQKPSVETVVYVKIIEETQLDQLKTGGVDVLSGITGGDSTKAALEVVDGENFAEVHYQRAGYGKIEFECDFGPTMFPEVRQAIAYLLNRTEFCQAFTGGYGVVVDGPYSPDFDMWRAVEDDIELIDYTFSPDNAKKVLEEGGWIYNSKGEPFVEGAGGVDSVRYKKLTEEEANALDIYGNDAGNKTFKSVANTDNITYETVEINGEYYMPLAINWFGSTPNPVTDLLSTTLANSSDLASVGMVIRATAGDFTTLLGNIYRDPSMGYAGTPIYGMLNLATGWNSAVYDYSFNWSSDPSWGDYSSNKVKDPYDAAFPYDQAAEKLTYEEALAASDGKLGMDYLSMAMVYNATTEDEYNQWWMAYIERWNQLMPDIPLYSNYYYDVYNANIENFETSPFFGPARAILYSNIKGY
ncbi:MAG: ABC transporter substrate-binding protein [Candidatus Faecousia sp.]|nr:ABC transporter substrate-binding protein [Clostridiales bacterium]MDY6181539.1 ABC transporter substrate-binding protein [Candidatus Faecousia sp.]